MLKQDPDISQMMILHTNRAFLCILGHIGAGFANFIEIQVAGKPFFFVFNQNKQTKKDSCCDSIMKENHN